MKTSLKLGITALSIAVLSACGGGGGDGGGGDMSFLSVDNTGSGVVCVENLFVDAYSSQGQQVANDLVAFYGIGNFSARPLNLAYSAPTYCGGPTSNPVPAPNVIIDQSYYYNVIVPSVR
ncbi:MAG: hypothetical protein ABIO88_03395 [Burkholderiaceae bacterium]